MPKSVVDQLIDELRARASKHAHGKLANPQEKTGFGYGHASGYYCALKDIEKLVEDILDQEKKRE